jgi:hypothetical protein
VVVVVVVVVVMSIYLVDGALLIFWYEAIKTYHRRMKTTYNWAPSMDIKSNLANLAT